MPRWSQEAESPAKLDRRWREATPFDHETLELFAINLALLAERLPFKISIGSPLSLDTAHEVTQVQNLIDARHLDDADKVLRAAMAEGFDMAELAHLKSMLDELIAYQLQKGDARLYFLLSACRYALNSFYHDLCLPRAEFLYEAVEVLIGEMAKQHLDFTQMAHANDAFKAAYSQRWSD